MSKITITLDASKLRELVKTRQFENKEGQLMQVQEVKFELVPVKEPKIIYEGTGYKLQKSHFASVIQTKEEREAQAETIFIGEGITTIWDNANNMNVFNATPVNSDDDDPQDLPF
jgi:hypothetical protein